MIRARAERWLPRAFVALTMFAAVPAHAEGPFEGTWREGTMSIQVDVQSWGGDCGPRPQSTTSPGGGTFPIAQEGDQLTFQMRRQRTTRTCWSENRAVRRVSSTYQAGTWRIVCRTPPEDSRAETGTYTIQAIGDNQISFRDVSAYDWQLNQSRCVATITTTQSFARVSAAPTRPSTPEPPREEPRPSCTPGAPARVIVRPGNADVPPGGQQCFTTRVVDAQGCPVRSQRVELTLAEGSPGTLDGRCYRAAAAEGQARLLGRTGELSGEATIAVRSMDLSDLIARRSEAGSVGGTGATESARADTAARVSARAPDAGMNLLWPAVALGLALMLVLGAGVALLRRRAGPKRRTIGGLRGVKIPEPEPVFRSRAAPDAERSDAHAAVSPQAGPPPAAPEPPREDMICPTCRRGHPPGSERCAHDGTALVPYREFASARGAENVCPACGARYPEHVKFCGTDGTTLEPAPR